MENSTTEPFNTANSNAMLGDGFLVPMTDFVLEQIKNFNAVVYDDLETASINLIERIENYANFLKQPLKLEMFVPCDEEGDILEEPTNYEKRLLNMMTEYNDEVYTYYQAKVKVLFEGFYIKRGSTDADNMTTYLMHNYFGEIAFKKDWKYEWEFIEDLESLSNLNEIELTESAIKQIVL